MKSSIKVLFWLYKSKRNAQGLIPIYIRVTLDKEKIEIASGYFVLLSQWQEKKKRVQESFPEGPAINNALEVQKARIIGLYNQLLSSGDLFTVDTIKKRYLGKDEENISLLQAIEYHNKKVGELVGKSYAQGTYDNYVYLADKVKGFLSQRQGKKDIPLKLLNRQFLSEFEHYLKTFHNNNVNTVAKGMTNFKTIINMALDMEWIVKDPFRRYRNKKEEPERTYLNEEEVAVLLETPMPNKYLQAVKDCMIFQIYTGLAYADLKKLSSSHIVRGIDGEQWIDLRRKKTGTRSALPLLPQAKAILEKHGSQQDRIEEGRLLPVLSNQKMNAQIKRVIELCGLQPGGLRIEKNISTHSLRRTFATTITLSKGVPIETVSKMLGHSDLKTTAIYAKVIDRKVSEDMKRLIQ